MVWDIIQPKDGWEQAYAHMEYLRIGLQAMFGKRIIVRDQNGCRLVNEILIHDDWCSCDFGDNYEI